MIEYEKRAMIEAEDKYTFRQSAQISMQTGLIGHLRADMDTDGNGFFSSWFDFREELKTDEFKAEFDEVINSLREEGDILHNRRALAKYCYCTPQSRMQEEPGYYGVRVDTEKYAYLLRLNPDRGEYNLYCYGFSSRVEWCACFVSWCANECGYIDTGVIPKFAGCVNGVQWFRERGQWADNAMEPSPGMIIFFDWDNKGSSGPQDGQADHVGIVQKIENGVVYTIEGNSGDSCRVNQYPVGYYEILGYGVPNP